MCNLSRVLMTPGKLGLYWSIHLGGLRREPDELQWHTPHGTPRGRSPFGLARV